MACGKTKLTRPAPARDLYIGPLFKAASAYAAAHYDRWFILSAKHRLVHPDTVLEPYEARMPKAREDRLVWARNVDCDLRCSPSSREGLGAFTMGGGKIELYFHAGRDYVAPMQELWGWRSGRHWASHYTPMLGLGIGEQLAWYRQARESPGEPPSSARTATAPRSRPGR